MKTAPRTALVATALIGIAACSPDRGVPSDPGSTNPLSVAPAAVTVAVGDTVRFSADTNPTAQPASWTVSDSRVALIENQTRASVAVRALHPGTTTVTATQGTRTGSAVLVVLIAGLKLVFTAQPSNTTAGVVLAPAVAVTIEDSSGQPLTSATNAVTVAFGTDPGGATLSGTTTVNPVNGTALFTDLLIDRPGTGYTLVATSGPLIGAPSAAFDIRRSKLVFTVQPSYTMAGVALTPSVAVTIEDSSGNPLTRATNAVTVAFGTNPGGATLSGTTTVNAVNGTAVFADLRIERPGAGYTLVATSGALTEATSVAFDVRGLLTLARVSAGGEVTCGVAPAGAAYCWGYLPGDGTSSRLSPGGVAGGLSFTTVSAGGVHACGVTPAGAAYCWGSNFYGALGDGIVDPMGGTAVDQASPAAVVGGLTFATVSAGSYHTCGVTPAGAAYCWGYNSSGELGSSWDGSTWCGTQPEGPVVPCSPTPEPVSGGLSFAGVSAGLEHTCGLTPAGAAYCWGLNDFGQLGDGTTASRSSPALVSGGLTFAQLSAGGWHTCGLTPAGAAYCWGANFGGALGDGTTTQRLNPVAVGGGLTFAQLTAGWEHTCGVTLAGAGYCWGDNIFGELGDGTTTNRHAPVLVSGGLSFAQLNAGGGVGLAHTCGVTLGSSAYCWGDNQYGEVGDGTTTRFRLNPVLVALP